MRQVKVKQFGPCVFVPQPKHPPVGCFGCARETPPSRPGAERDCCVLRSSEYTDATMRHIIALRHIDETERCPERTVAT